MVSPQHVIGLYASIFYCLFPLQLTFISLLSLAVSSMTGYRRYFFYRCCYCVVFAYLSYRELRNSARTTHLGD